MFRPVKTLQRLALAFVTALLLLCPARTYASEINATNIVRVMNVYREHHHLPPFIEDPRMDAAAGDRMTEMEELGYWAHISPDGRPPFRFLKLRGYFYSSAGENLASGFETSEVMVEAWMQSTGHRENILSNAYANVGIAVIDGTPMGRAVGKSVVLMFGRELVTPISETPDR